MNKFLLGLSGLAVMVSLASCDRKTGGTRVVASFHNMSEPFFVAMRRNAEDEAKKLGIDLQVVDGQSNSAKQTSDIQSAIATGAQGIVLAPTDVHALAPAVDNVLAADIPVVTVDRTVDGTTKPVPHVGADNIAGGRIMADFIVSRFPQGARILLLTGSPGSSSAIDRTRGIREALKAAGPKYSLIAEQTANWQREQGLTVTQNVLTSLGAGRPQAILAENDDMALGAVEALRGAGIKDVAVVGFDAMPETLKLVRSGEMAATVEQSPSRQIRTALQQLVGNIRDKRPIAGASIAPILITRDTLGKAERLTEVK